MLKPKFKIKSTYRTNGNRYRYKPFYKTFWFYVIVIPVFLYVIGNPTKEDKNTSNNTSNSGEWYQGGTLHNATVQEWQQATYENRLATSADWFVSITKARNSELKKKLDDLPTSLYLSSLKAFAIQLEKLVSDIVNDKRIAKSSDRVAEYASMCYITMYGVK
jgi:hypothetical protein